MNQWDFGRLSSDPETVSRAKRALERYDISGFCNTIKRKVRDPLLFVERNMEMLKRETYYEHVLVHAYRAFFHPDWSIDRLVALFRAADLEQLRAINHHRQLSGTVTLFRAVAGPADARRINGLSWAINPGFAVDAGIETELARSRISGASDPPPALYRITVQAPDDIFLCLPDGEVVLLPPLPARPQRVLTDRVSFGVMRTARRIMASLPDARVSPIDYLRKRYGNGKVQR